MTINSIPTILLLLISITQQWERATDISTNSSSQFIQTQTFTHDNLYLITAGTNKKISIFITSDYRLYEQLNIGETVLKILSHPSNYTIVFSTNGGNLYNYNIGTKNLTKISANISDQGYITDMEWFNANATLIIGVGSNQQLKGSTIANAYIYNINFQTNKTFILQEFKGTTKLSSVAMSNDYSSFLVSSDEIEINIVENGTNGTVSNVNLYASSTGDFLQGFDVDNENKEHLFISFRVNSTNFFAAHNNSNFVEEFSINGDRVDTFQIMNQSYRVSAISGRVENLLAVGITSDTFTPQLQFFIPPNKNAILSLSHSSTINLAAVSPNLQLISVGQATTGITVWHYTQDVVSLSPAFIAIISIIAGFIMAITIGVVVSTAYAQQPEPNIHIQN